jgi:hypothetical protein
MNNTEWLKQLSGLTGLPYYPEHKVFGDKSGALIGSSDGYIVALGSGKDEGGHAAIKMLLRYAKAQDAKQVKQAIDPVKGKFKNVKTDETSAVLSWTYSFGKPEATSVAQALPNILAAIKTVTSPIAGKCEECGRTEPQIVLMNDIPTHHCASCQEQVSHKLDAAAVEYEKLDTNLTPGLLYGLVAALLGSIAWGGVAYLIHRIFLWGAIIIGVFIGKAVVMGTGKVTWPARILMGVLTALSVGFGDALFYALTVMRGEQVAFMVALKAVLANYWKIETDSQGGVISIIFGLIGAAVVMYSTRKPAFKATFVPLGTPATTLSSAAGK